MTDTPDMFECRLVGYSKQSRKDGDWVEIRLHIHPDDVTPALAQAPLKTVFMVAAVPVQSEANVAQEKPKRSWDTIPLSEQAGILCRDPNFQDWMLRKARVIAWHPDAGGIERNDLTRERVLRHCGASSRSELSRDTDAGDTWLALDEEYRQSQGLIAERTT